jgi:type IV pilus assembly protein PilB
MLVRQGLLTRPQLDRALQHQQHEKGTRLGKILVEFGFATETQICECVASQLNLPAADMLAVDVPQELLSQVSKELAFKYTCLPWFAEERELYLIMADPMNVEAIDTIGFHTGKKVKPVIAPESDILAALERFYGSPETSLAQFGNLALSDQVASLELAEEPEITDENLADVVISAPLVRLVNAILTDAVRSGASDIHLEPAARGLNLRYRVDGLLRRVMVLPKRLQAKVLSRLKIASQMDIAEHRKPQDGRAFIRVAAGSYDLRVSSLPTSHGEKIVIRILAQERAKVSLDDLGYEPDTLASFKDVLRRPQGMILVTGPTGSGKTSTLYASLNHLLSETNNIITVEDPVEYRLEGVNQVAVSERTGMTFTAGLRSILRQDPDIIMVGEIRDLETAQIAFQAAQTGHLVLSTLHTNDAPSAVTRLVQMGMPAYAVASSLLAVQAQRLVRKLCACKTVAPDGTATPKGCEFCRYSGWLGRLGVYELMRITPAVRSALLAEGSEDAVRRAARASGMVTMNEDGRRKVGRGLTMIDELNRVVAPDETGGAREQHDEEPGDPGAASAGGDPPESRPARVLVVDDDATLIEVLLDTLSAGGYEVRSAADGRSALALVYRERPDLILTDLHMPDMNGLQLLRHVRGDLSTCQIPVVFLTTDKSLDAEIRALDLGADDYLNKPVEMARLLGRVHRALVRARLQLRA